MIYLKQSTASQEIPLGYFLDSTDGDTEETGLTIANTDIKLWKTGATTLANKNSGGATHISNGIYYAVLDATDTGTLGPMVIFVHVSGALTVRLECVVMPTALYDAMYGSGCPELTGVPSATPDLATMGMLWYMERRNARITDSAVEEDKVSNSAGTVILERPFTDVASVLTVDKVQVP